MSQQSQNSAIIFHEDNTISFDKNHNNFRKNLGSYLYELIDKFGRKIPYKALIPLFDIDMYKTFDAINGICNWNIILFNMSTYSIDHPFLTVDIIKTFVQSSFFDIQEFVDYCPNGILIEGDLMDFISIRKYIIELIDYAESLIDSTNNLIETNFKIYLKTDFLDKAIGCKEIFDFPARKIYLVPRNLQRQGALSAVSIMSIDNYRKAAKHLFKNADDIPQMLVELVKNANETLLINIYYFSASEWFYTEVVECYNKLNIPLVPIKDIGKLSKTMILKLFIHLYIPDIMNYMDIMPYQDLFKHNFSLATFNNENKKVFEKFAQKNHNVHTNFSELTNENKSFYAQTFEISHTMKEDIIKWIESDDFLLVPRSEVKQIRDHLLIGPGALYDIMDKLYVRRLLFSEAEMKSSWFKALKI